MTWLSYVVLAATAVLAILIPDSVLAVNAFFDGLVVGPFGLRLAVVAVLAVTASGVLNGAFYHRDRRNTWVHPVQLVEMFFILLLFFLATGNAVASVGVALLSNVLFQAGINRVGYDHPLVWAGEAATYKVGSVDVPKEFYGRGRYVQALVGIVWIWLGLSQGSLI